MTQSGRGGSEGRVGRFHLLPSFAVVRPFFALNSWAFGACGDVCGRAPIPEAYMKAKAALDALIAAFGADQQQAA
jgi:hypothetical protein